VLGGCCEAEVEEHEVLRALRIALHEADVGGLDVLVDDAELLQSLHRAEEVIAPAPRLVEPTGRSGAALREGLARVFEEQRASPLESAACA
jgi:hypothetical protein